METQILGHPHIGGAESRGDRWPRLAVKTAINYLLFLLLLLLLLLLLFIDTRQSQERPHLEKLIIISVVQKKHLEKLIIIYIVKNHLEQLTIIYIVQKTTFGKT